LLPAFPHQVTRSATLEAIADKFKPKDIKQLDEAYKGRNYVRLWKPGSDCVSLP
jgi:hypothetical protein